MRGAAARHGRIVASLTMSLFVAAACGTTAPQGATSSAPAGAGAGGGLTVPSGAPGQGGSTAGGGSTTVGTTTGGGSTTGGTTSGGAGGSSAAGGEASTGDAAPGITGSTIYVGAIYTKNVAAANEAIGGSKRGNGDAREVYDTVIDDINRHGGIGGRKVVPIFAPLDATSSTPIGQQRQAACARWTQDNEVFAILAGGDPILEECARKAGAVELYSTVAGGGTVPETFRRYPNYVEIAGMDLVRMGGVTVDGLAHEGYFDKGAKIGVVTWDDPGFREGIKEGYIPALARHGLKLATPPVYLSPPQTVQDLGATSAQARSAVLKFQTVGVNHVLLLDGSAGLCGIGCIGLEFMTQAKSQQYYPRYGLNDNSAPVEGYKGGTYPADELRRSVAVTWTDINKTYDVGWHVNQTREGCYALMRKHGVDMGNLDAETAAMEACDELSFLRTLVAGIGQGSLTPAALMGVADGLGSSFESTSVFGTQFAAAKHAGVSLVRTMRFVDSCSCFRYTSSPHPPG